MGVLPGRRSIGEMTYLGSRYALCGMDCLTLRVEDGQATFFMHRRDPTKVAAAADTLHGIRRGVPPCARIRREGRTVALAICS